LFAPVGAQPLKPGGAAASFEDRLEMTRLAIADEPGFELSLADAPRESREPNYTLETLRTIRAELAPRGALFCLMGADAFWGLKGWHRAEEIPFVAPLIVASRPGQPLDGLIALLPPELTLESAPGPEETRSGVRLRSCFLLNRAGSRTPFFLLPGLNVEISASEIRAQLHAALESRATGDELLPRAVGRYVRSRGLYR
jgi:nicotinate-nucleotide adenylyltransferase